MKSLLLSFFMVSWVLNAQEKSFEGEVNAIAKKYDTLWDSSKETIVFTGSSSIRQWESLQERFPNQQIVNTGFGGSQASDLLQYSKILRTIISDVQTRRPNTQIILIAVKPSPARWQLKKQYKKLNRQYKRLSKKNQLLDFADVWTPMLNEKKVRKDIFTNDQLHMNDKGYQIWYNVLMKFVED